MRTITLSLIAAIVSALVLTGCGKAKESREPTVTVSLPPEAWLTSQIAGDRMRVNTLLPAGANPETYDPTVSDIRRLAASDLFLVSGSLEFEKKVSGQLPEGLPVSDLSEGIELIYDTHGHAKGLAKGHGDGHEHGHGEEGHSHAYGDPHTWSSTKNARIIVANILEALSEADPDGKGYYEKNARRLTARIDSLDRAYTQRLGSEEGRTFLIWHPSLSYLARDYGLRQLPLGMENKEQSVRSLKAVVDTARKADPIVMFVQPEYDTPSAASMAREIGVRTVVINPLNPDWMGEMEATLDALASGKSEASDE